jgi:hypothetical protein
MLGFTVFVLVNNRQPKISCILVLNTEDYTVRPHYNKVTRCKRKDYTFIYRYSAHLHLYSDLL